MEFRCSIATQQAQRAKCFSLCGRRFCTWSGIARPFGGFFSRCFMLLKRFRLGIRLSDADSNFCPACGELMDVCGDHALCCTTLGFYARHSELRTNSLTSAPSWGFVQILNKALSTLLCVPPTFFSTAWVPVWLSISPSCTICNLLMY